VFPRDFYQTLSRTVHAEFRTRRAVRALRALAANPLAIDRKRIRAIGGLTELPRWLAGRVSLERRKLTGSVRE
jgi:hypothetical protein